MSTSAVKWFLVCFLKPAWVVLAQEVEWSEILQFDNWPQSMTPAVSVSKCPWARQWTLECPPPPSPWGRTSQCIPNCWLQTRINGEVCLGKIWKYRVKHTWKHYGKVSYHLTALVVFLFFFCGLSLKNVIATSLKYYLCLCDVRMWRGTLSHIGWKQAARESWRAVDSPALCAAPYICPDGDRDFVCVALMLTHSPLKSQIKRCSYLLHLFSFFC